jgi:hypothetical protein
MKELQVAISKQHILVVLLLLQGILLKSDFSLQNSMSPAPPEETIH